jgi:pimeloyl-ACP methyl ester carboxylesterase
MGRAFARRGLHLELLNLNQPSFSRLTFSEALAEVDRWYESVAPAPVVLMGSSMGGYLSALWAQLHPEVVQRLVLLCPAFDLHDRWVDRLGQEAVNQWRDTGEWTFEDGAGQPTAVHWRLVEDAQRWPSRPEVPCPTLIIHGTQDDVVPVDSSRRYQAASPGRVELLEVTDDHALRVSMEEVERASARFLSLPQAP